MEEAVHSPRSVRFGPFEVSTLSGSEGLYSPIGHPAGRYVLAKSLDSPKLMQFDFSTHKWAELVSSPADYPNWSHDGSYIYFINPYIAEPAVYRIRISDRKLELNHEPEPPAPGMEHRGEVDGSCGR